jgi:prepilin-type processing-associated H-X9-DG protein
MGSPSTKAADPNLPQLLNYESVRCRRHPGAMPALVLGIVGVATSCVLVGIFPGLVAIGMGIWAGNAVQRRADLYSGKAHANAGIAFGCIACIVPFILLSIPSISRSRPLANRSLCAANMRGIAQSLNVYAADNGDLFPVVPFAPYGIANSGASTATCSGNVEDASKSVYGAGSTQDGSPLAGIWLLVLKNYTSPKQYICKEDRFVTDAAAIEKSPGVCYVNFQSPHQLSYSVAYPYAPDGKVGAWWKNTSDSSLPIACDMAPVNGTGKPVRNVAPGAVPKNPKTWNSANHEGDGENVAFADGHAEFVRRPDVGQGDDNIFTGSGVKGVSPFGGTQPGKAPIEIWTEAAPFDVVMVPERDLDRGGF